MRTLPYLLSASLFTLAGCNAPPVPTAALSVATPDAGVVDEIADTRRPHTDLTPLPPVQPGISAYDPEPACSDQLTLGAGEKLGASTGGSDHGLSVTSDELSAAWMTESGGAVTIHHVDRAHGTDAFGAPRSITGAFAAGRIALKSDGLELAVVDAGGLGFSVLRRSERGEAFGDPEVGPFELLDNQGRDELGPAGEHYADPLYANGDKYFIFSRVPASGAGKVHIGSRFMFGAPFSPGVPFAEEALAPAGSKRKSVTGASVDVRTLFVWDETAAKSVVVRLSAKGAIESTTDLGAARDVQPTADCRVFWFTSGSPSDVRRFAAP